MPNDLPDDPADHARRFAEEYADWFENFVEGRMHALDVPEEQIGASDHVCGVAWRVFFPNESDGGGVSPGNRINVDSGVLNPELMASLGPVASGAWAKSRLRDRIDAVIVHEFEEAALGSHDQAVSCSPETRLPVGPRARALLRAIAQGAPSR